MRRDELQGLATPAGIFDAFTGPGGGAARRRFQELFEVVALPGERLHTVLREGDVVIQRALGEGSLARRTAIEAATIRDFAPGARLPFDRLVLRPASRAGGEALESDLAERTLPFGDAAATAISPFSEKLYPTGMDPAAAHNARLSAALQTVRGTLAPANRTRLDKAAIFVCKLVPRPAVLEYAGVRELDMFFSASLLKVSLLYASFELVARVNKVAPLLTAGSAPEFFAKVKQTFDGKIAGAVPDITPGAWRKTKFDAALTATASVAGVFSVRMSDLHRRDLESIFFDQLQNAGARDCIHRLGFSYINGALAAAGFFGPVTQLGIWLATDFISDNPPGPDNWPSFYVPVSTGGKSSAAMTALSMAHLLSLIFREELIDAAGSRDMRAIFARGAAWLSTLPNQGAFSFVATGAKVGHESSDTAKVGKVMSEAAFLRRKTDGAEFVAVWQNVPDPLGAEPIYRVIDEVVRTWP